ncbi:MAG: bacteriochlorophyll 4-vinyl reductase [Henriciella sp.]|uniref:bacteriochlorophyll 4-vinyl reductase n=1 Tax=Henriciella sp. TaxID=1968823 RepID=UPI003C76AEA6
MSLGVQTPLTTAPAPESARVGPNAVLQLEQALCDQGGAKAAELVFARAGLQELLRVRPQEMIDERLPRALFDSLFAHFPEARAQMVVYRAGRLTGDYILKNRIPKPVRLLLKLLPAPLSRDLLLKAIHRHAWTFAGSGRCTFTLGRAAEFRIEANPLTMPGCAWHVGVFDALFQHLVSRRTTITYNHACLDGLQVCCFSIETQYKRYRAPDQ